MRGSWLRSILLLPLWGAVISCGAKDEPLTSAIDSGCGISLGSTVAFDVNRPPCTRLSTYRFFLDAQAREPNTGVLPYDLVTPLFSDYAHKRRFVWIPPGTSVTYSPDKPFDFPVGSVLVKTFFYSLDERDGNAPERRIETRLLVRRNEGWQGWAYVWNEEQTDALLTVAGANRHIDWIDAEGESRTVEYHVPNSTECQVCHELTRDEMLPIGLQARHLNRNIDYAEGPENQLERWIREGFLEGAPDSASWPRDAQWNDPASGSVEARARGYLEINCAHCHSRTGNANLKELELAQDVTDPQILGICVLQGAQAEPETAQPYNIYPGHPEKSRIVYRISSTDSGVRMPRLGRTLVHKEGVALISEWITSMNQPCP